MRWRLGLKGDTTGQGSGYGRGFAALAQVPANEIMAAGAAQDDALKQQLTGAQIAAQLASAEHAKAQGRLANAEATGLEGTPDTLDTVIAGKLGVRVPQVRQWVSETRGKPMTQQVEVGPSLDEPAYTGTATMAPTDPALGARLAQEYARLAPARINPKSYTVQGQADASGKYQGQDAIDRVVAAGANPDGSVNPNAATPLAALVGQAFAAEKGLQQVHAVGNTGRSINGFTGAGGVIEPGMAVLFDDKTRSETADHTASAGAHKAAGVNSYASAKLHGAQFDKTVEETNQLKTGPKGVLHDSGDGLLSVDPRTNVATPVTLAGSGERVAPKLKDIPAAQNHAYIENAKAVDNIDRAIAAITQATGIKLDENGDPVRDTTITATDPNALGARNYLGDGIRQRTDPKGVSVRAQLANIGGAKFHEISGAAVSLGEAKRLTPFIPQATDGPGAALQKLQNLRREYQTVNDMLQQTYSKDQGFKPSAGARPAGGKGGKDGAPVVSNW
jgi:hypothetical protein